MKFEYGIKIYEPGQENILLPGFFVLPYFFVLRVTYIYIDIYKYKFSSYSFTSLGKYNCHCQCQKMIEKNVFICLVIQKIIYTFVLLFALRGNCINDDIFLDKG